MLKQYRILTHCLSELRISEMPTMEKLKLEVQLIQTKRILLGHEVERRVRGSEASETEFNHLYNLVLQACHSDDANEGFNVVNFHLQKIKDNLNSDSHVVPRAIENRVQKFFAKQLFRRMTL